MSSELRIKSTDAIARQAEAADAYAIVVRADSNALKGLHGKERWPPGSDPAFSASEARTADGSSAIA